MDSEKNEVTVGDEIRAVRKARRVTLKDLSQRTGRSVAYLSRIERGSARLSVDLLQAIGEALDVDPKWFFPSRAGASYNERAYVVRADARRPLSNLYTRHSEELGFVDELLSSSIAGELYMMISRFPPGTDHQAQPGEGYVYEGEQHGIVTQGRVEMILGDDIIALETGDSFSYSTLIPHRFRNAGDQEAMVVWAMTPVRITW